MKRFLIGSAALMSVLTATSALAADLSPRMYTKEPVVAAVVYDWTGFYVGGNVGYGWGRASNTFGPLPDSIIFGALAPQTLDSKPAGVIGGGQIGYNWQSGKFVYGLEADIQGSNVKGDVIVSPIIQNPNVGPPIGLPAFLESNEKLSWFGTVRARAGFTPVDRLLLYVTGGFAYGHVDYFAQTNFAPGVPSVIYLATVSALKTGWTVGAGGEWAIANSWSVKAEYLYIDLGSESAIGNPLAPHPPFQVAYSWKTQDQIARVGLNYKFGGPVVARY